MLEPDGKGSTRLPNRSRTVLIGVLVVALIVMGGLWWRGERANDLALEKARAEASAERQAQEAKREAGTAKKQVEKVVDECKPDPDSKACRDAVDDAEDVTDTLDTPTSSELSAQERAEVILLADEVMDQRPELTEAQVIERVLRRIRQPRDGKTPTTAQVRAIVAAVYAANPPQDGRDGTTPQCVLDGNCKGSDGRGISTTNITATGDLVITYTDGTSVTLGRVVPQCVLDGNCKGADGSNGSNGTDGQDGRGVDRIACEAGQLVAYYSDDTSQTIDGSSCIATPAPDPTPDPQPQG